MDGKQDSQVVSEMRSNGIMRRIALLAFLIVCAAGAVCLGRAINAPDLEWRLLALAMLAFISGPITTELRGRNENVSIRIPILYLVLFGSSLVLSPFCAALPGAFGGIARLIFKSSGRKPIYQVLYIILKPAAVSVGASLVFMGTGGNILRPQDFGSIIPVICAAFTFMAANWLLAGVTDELQGRGCGSELHAITLFAGWCMCFLGGYLCAVLYASMPTYVLFVPGTAIVFAGYALRSADMASERKKIASPPQIVVDEIDDSESEEGFIDSSTGLANQRYLNMFLNREVRRSERGAKQLSVAVCDVQGFKQSADVIDHDANETIVNIGRRLESGLRAYDLIARNSAGRFVIVLPETSSAVAYLIVKRLHESLGVLKVNDTPVFVSIGIATFPENGITADDLINSAHRALNRGKVAGLHGVYCCENLKKAG